jgi:hypothetical protein
MAEQHPLTPPRKLVEQWREQAPRYRDGGVGREVWLINRAYSAGADEELEACCKWLQHDYPNIGANALRAARRPKPPSLKEQALLQLDTLNADLAMHGRGCDLSQIRRALEALPE